VKSGRKIVVIDRDIETRTIDAPLRRRRKERDRLTTCDTLFQAFAWPARPSHSSCFWRRVRLRRRR
jgi:hypothetical protein